MLNVLLVENSTLIRACVIDIIEDLPEVHLMGYAQNVTATKQLMSKIKPDVIILDIRLPDGTGIDLLKWIKIHSPPTTVIMFTNYSYSQYRNKCKDLGAEFFFDKSNDFEKIAITLVDQVSKKDRMQDQELIELNTIMSNPDGTV